MRYWSYVAAVTVGCLLPGGAFAQNKTKDVPLARILADWKQRQGLLKTARYVIAGTTEFKDARLPPGNTVWPRRTVLLFDFDGQRYREQSSKQIIRERANELEYIPRVSTSAFDGKIGQSLIHRDLNRIQEDGPDMIIGKGEHPAGTGFDGHVWPVLFAHGLVPTVHTDVQVGKLPPVYDPEDFEVLGRQSLNGRDYTVVRTEPQSGNPPVSDELWLDPNQNSAIYRYVHFNGSNPWYRTDVTWKKTDFGWWPDHWTLTWTMNGRGRRVYRLRVESFQANPAVANSDFSFPVTPGMKVDVVETPGPGTGMNAAYQASTSYVISASGSWEEVSAKGFTTLEGKLLPPERSRTWLWWTAALGTGVSAVVYYLWRRGRKMNTV